jgi:hypothetical protein
MDESDGIDSSFWGPKRCRSLILMICGYAGTVEAGASRREAAESFNLCPSSAVKWLQRWRDTGSAKAKPTGGEQIAVGEARERTAGSGCGAPGFDT